MGLQAISDCLIISNFYQPTIYQFTQKMSAKKQKDNSDEIVVLALAVVPLIFSIYHYFSLNSKYMTDGNVHRVSDLGGQYKIFLYTGGASLVGCFLLWNLAAVSGWILLIALPVFLYLMNWVGKAQALAFLGVVVDYNTGVAHFKYAEENFTLTDYLMVLPIIKSWTRYDTVEIGQIERITRQAGVSLFLHGPFTSRRITFSNKLKRDECIHLLMGYTSSQAEISNELE